MFVPDRIELALLPTPLHRLPRVSEQLGLDTWIKRDDLTGLALGGNKARKLEFLMADVGTSKADVVITCGSMQSNFIRQLGAACSMMGVRCVAAVMELPFEHAQPPKPSAENLQSGNVLLDGWLGVELRVFGDDKWDVLFDKVRAIEEEFRDKGARPYVIPVGGSSPLGAMGFYRAAEEVLVQKPDVRTVVTASSSGSTQVGLALGLRESNVRLVGIGCDPEPEITEDYARLSRQMCEAFGMGKPMEAADFELRQDFVGPGYGVPSDGGQAAIEYLARTEGIFLDPVYSGKAFDGLLKMARNREIEGPVVFWHTGGTPALFAVR
ncbi:MAG: D-cysteine desulfhydrase [Fimbriimonadaceae bacterium]|nr:D-cysteine desulfhydrase [Fimbriimonadaceae bacterium]